MVELPGFSFLSLRDGRKKTVPESVLEAIKLGQWDFEPQHRGSEEYNSTSALPGSNEKISVLAERAKGGLPLWHPEDRVSYDDSEKGLW